MKKDTAGPGTESTTPMWESLERMVRERAQEFIQQILEEEVTEVLGREKSERKSAVDPAPGYRNGYGKPRRLSMSSGTVTVRRPRVRGLEERFESRVLPLFARRTKEVGELIPELYLHGLAEGDFELALRGLLGEGAPLSKASIRRLRASWTEEFEAWAQRSLADREVVYVWADGIYVKARQAFKKRFGPWYPKAVAVLEDDWDRMVTFYDFPEVEASADDERGRVNRPGFAGDSNS
ncbi:MAG: transposase [Gemmatimonadota bacterium]